MSGKGLLDKIKLLLEGGEKREEMPDD